MPEIKQYRQQTSAPGPNKMPAYTADQFGAQQGEATANLGKAVMGAADVVAKRLDQENTSDVTARLTKAHAELAVDLQNTIRTAQPGDKKAFEDYNKRVDDTVGKIGDDASTQSARAFYSEASARIKGQLYKTASEGQAELAGVKAVTDYTSTLNNLSAATLADPSSIALQREMHTQAINNLVATGQLPTEKATQLQAQGDTAIVKASIRGWAQLNPDYAKGKLKSGEFDNQLGAEGKVQLLGEVEQAQRAKEIDIERQRMQQERVQKKAQQQTQNTLLEALTKGDLSTKDILNSNLEAFGSGSKEQFLQLAKARNNPEEKLKTDPTVLISLFNRIHLPDDDPNKLTDENELNKYVGAGLSFVDLGRMRGEIQGRGTEAGKIESDMKKQVLEIAKGKLTKSNPLTGFRDPVGDEQYAKFMAGFQDDYAIQRQAGKSARELLDPTNPDYLGKNIDQYVRTPQQIMRDMAPKRSQPAASTLSGGLFNTKEAGAAPTPKYSAPPAAKPLPRQPGETAKAYLARIKGGG